MACAIIVGFEVPHFNLVLSVLIIACGVATASYGAVDFNVMGLVIMFSSLLSESVRLVMTQMLLQGYKFNASMCVLFACIEEYVVQHHPTESMHSTHSRGSHVYRPCLRILALNWLVTV